MKPFSGFHMSKTHKMQRESKAVYWISSTDRLVLFSRKANNKSDPCSKTKLSLEYKFKTSIFLNVFVKRFELIWKLENYKNKSKISKIQIYTLSYLLLDSFIPERLFIILNVVLNMLIFILIVHVTKFKKQISSIL